MKTVSGSDRDNYTGPLSPYSLIGISRTASGTQRLLSWIQSAARANVQGLDAVGKTP